MLQIICLTWLCASALAVPLDTATHASHHDASVGPSCTHGLRQAGVRLSRPSPINPDVPSAPRPVDKILPTKVTDEDLKHNGDPKRESQTIVDAAPGVAIPIKKFGEVLHSDLKVPQGPQVQVTKSPPLENPVEHKQVKRDAGKSDQTQSLTRSDDNQKKPAKTAQLPMENKPSHAHNDAAASHSDSSKPDAPKTSKPLSAEAPSTHEHHNTSNEQSTHEAAEETQKSPAEQSKLETLNNPANSHHSPAFVHPVPVSQIVKNSAAVPVTHASRNGHTDE